MQTRQLLASLAVAALLTACGGNKEMNNPQAEEAPVNLSDQMLLGTLWMQQSVEARVIKEQLFEVAKEKLSHNMSQYKGKKPLAVIVDIDETILDNAPYSARLVKTGKDFNSETWNAWVNEANADLVPGAADFLKYAESKGVEVFYISNRRDENRDITIENLRNFELPYADETHVMLRTETSDKTERRNQVKSQFKVLLLVGDQMTDFAEQVEEFQPDVPNYNIIMDSLKSSFVLLPNPLYGEFESMIYQHQSNLSNKQKDELRRRMLYTKEKRK